MAKQARQVQWLKAEEIKTLQEWMASPTCTAPTRIIEVLSRILAAYAYLAQTKSRAGQSLSRMREAMGIEPKSETSKRVLTDKQKLALLRSQRKGLDRTIKKYENQLGLVKKRSKAGKKGESPASGEDDFRPPHEQLFSGALANLTVTYMGKKVNRSDHFGPVTTGLHSTMSLQRRRLQVDLTIEERRYSVETVTDLRTGKSVTASMDDVGPPGFEVTWDTIANLIMMAAVYAIPMSRMEKMLKATSPYFSSGRIAELIMYGAELLEPIYTHMGEQLSECSILSGDDTNTRVLEMEQRIREEDEKGVRIPRSALVRKIASTFGRISNIKDGSRPQKRYNVSVITGKTDLKDNRSYIYFFHSHLGHLGNLLTQLLSMRSPRNKTVTIQSDLLSSNMPDAAIASKFDIRKAGCMSHARRPFFRYRLDDPELCITMLRAFLTLSSIEDRIDEHGRTRECILKYRKRFGLRVWQIIYDMAKATTIGQPIEGRYWPKDAPLRKACEYIVNNFEELTLYCSDPHLELTNNLRERLLRWDKIMLDSSKFRKSERGRASINILRTLLHTASAAQVNPKEYLIWVFHNFRDIKSHPEKYTPYAYALEGDRRKCVQ